MKQSQVVENIALRMGSPGFSHCVRAPGTRLIGKKVARKVARLPSMGRTFHDHDAKPLCQGQQAPWRPPLCWTFTQIVSSHPKVAVVRETANLDGSFVSFRVRYGNLTTLAHFSVRTASEQIKPRVSSAGHFRSIGSRSFVDHSFWCLLRKCRCDRYAFCFLNPFALMEKSKKKETPTSESGRRPIKAFRLDDVHASIFARTHNDRTYYSWTITRGYKDNSGTFRYTSSLNGDDCGKVAELAKMVSEAIVELEQAE